MKLKSELFCTIATAIVALTIGDAIATPAPLASVQSACRQHGTTYQHLYSFEADGFTITICKKGAQHYYLKLPKFAPDANQEATPSLKPTPAKSSRIDQA